MKLTSLLLLLALTALPCVAQTTVVSFDTPPCSGSLGTYQGINFSASPWDCETSSLSGDATTTLSWNQQVTSGKFSFVAPSVLVSLRASSSSGAGTITISTDAGESVPIVAQPGVMPAAVNTGFLLPATVVTVTFPGGWTIHLDDLTYTTGSVTPPPPPPPPPMSSFSVSAQSLTFPLTQNGTMAVPLNLTVTNTGTASLTISLVNTQQTAGQGSGADYGVYPALNALSPLAPGASTTFLVLFLPRATGSIPGNLLIQAGGQTINVPLTGTAQ